jgi:heme/copper-type cytochrome/quinol oxidase subunit 2
LVKGTVTTQFKLLVWIGGFLQFIIGILLLLLPDLILLDQMDLAYPYLNYELFLIIAIIGWIDAITGILSIILGFWAGKITKYGLNIPEEELKTRGDVKRMWTYLVISSIFLLVGFPIGTFIGITLLYESRNLKKGREIEERPLISRYQYIIWGGAMHLIFVGLAFELLVSFAIGEPMSLLYPYITCTILFILQVVGWIFLIVGLTLLTTALYVVKLTKYRAGSPTEEKGKSRKGIKFIRIVIIISSIFLLVVIPAGTIMGITLIRESWMLKE